MENKEYKEKIIELVEKIQDDYLLKVAYSFVQSVAKEKRAGG